MPARHILIPIHDFSAGGTELIAFRLARHWLAAGRRVSFLVGARDGPLAPRVPNGAEVHILSPERPRSPLSRLFLGGQMAPVAKALSPDMLFIPGNFHFGLGAAMKAAMPHVPVVAKISNPLLQSPADSAWLRSGARLALRALTRGIDWFAAMSRGLAEEAREQLGHERVSLLYDPNIADEAQLDFAPRPAHPDMSPLHLLAIGRLEPQKDFMLALDVVAALHRRRPVSLRICGAGPLEGKLARRIRQLGLEDVVTLAGFSTDLAPEFRRADLLLITSRYEGGPAVAAEALLHGLPVVSTDCSHFLRDLITDPLLGTLVGAHAAGALADAAEAQARRPGPAPALVAPAIAPVRMESAAGAYLALFDRVADRRG